MMDAFTPIFAGVTLTGADERTDLGALEALVAEHGELEIGLLYSEKPEDRPRYPSLRWIEKITTRLPGVCALHVCGVGARDALKNGTLSAVLHNIRRVQVNGHVEPGEIAPIAMQFPIVVMQWQPGRDNPDLESAIARAELFAGLGHQWLVDGSGGRGRLPGSWFRPSGPRPVGFAGGLGPETLADELPKIAAVAHGHWWVDMEQSLRTDDWFDLDRCRAALAAAEAWRREEAEDEA
ncbi:MAG: hypothetical protein EPN36_14015 [Rhodanobacteraceae bacterium]|nr:MAG: hypothetical protein EPN36_14015 [Rhodanobacteraceae bacterium]